MAWNFRSLDDLWGYVEELNRKHFPDNDLMPVLGNGKTHRPKIMFILINPTARNISSNKNWRGPRFPFVGTKQFWRVFHRAGLFDDKLLNKINSSTGWSVEFTNKVLQFLKNKGFYLTNIVKWTGYDATLPDSKKIKLFLPVLEREIELVRPEYIVTFGLIPFHNITEQRIKISEYYDRAMKSGKLKLYDLKISSVKAKVIPCYFPIGRGKPKKAVELLRLVKKL